MGGTCKLERNRLFTRCLSSRRWLWVEALGLWGRGDSNPRWQVGDAAVVATCCDTASLRPRIKLLALSQVEEKKINLWMKLCHEWSPVSCRNVGDRDNYVIKIIMSMELWILLWSSWLAFDVEWADAAAGVYLVLAVGASHEVVDDRKDAMWASGAAHEGGFAIGCCHIGVI